MLGGRYRVLDRIGSGGMAEVFRARDEVLDRLVAVKVFRAEYAARGDANGAARQQLEVAALARLNHPNLIALYDGSLGRDDGPAFIVMELIEGPSLAARIAQGPLPEASVREIAIQLADGLAYVHAQGMVHRDVKPENILLGVDRSDDDSTVRARLSDFGIVRLLGSERLTSADLTLGTASYLAPEQARGSHVDPPADIYALGLVLLEALTGRRAYDGPALEAALARLSQRPEIPAGLPEPWPRLLHAMTETDAGLRPSAAEVARVLRNEGSRAMPLVPLAVPVAAGFADAPTGMLPVAAGAAAGSGPAPVVAARHRRVSPLAIVAALSLLAILAVLGIFLFGGSGPDSPAQAPPGRTPAADQSSSTRASKSPSARKTGTAPAVVPVATTPAKSASSARSSSAPATAHPPTGHTSPHAPTPPRHSSPAARPTPPSSPAKPPSTSSTPTQPAPSTSAGATGSSAAAASPPADASTAAG